MNLEKIIGESLSDASRCLNEFQETEKKLHQIKNAALLMIQALKNSNTIFSCGNGGSACDAEHFAEELTGRYRHDRKPLAAIALTNAAHITCVGNDFGFNEIFARSIQALCKPGDVLLAISTSGNSENIVKAAEMTKLCKGKVIALTGAKESKLSNIADITIHTPESAYSDRVQELHIKCIHILIECIENQLFK